MARTRGLTLQAADRPTLEQWARSQSLPHHQVQRARMLLGLGTAGQAAQVEPRAARERAVAEAASPAQTEAG